VVLDAEALSEFGVGVHGRSGSHCIGSDVGVSICGMTTRRAFLQALSAGLVSASSARLVGSPEVPPQTPFQHPASGTIGLQLYSLRHLFEKGDIAGTLAMVRRWGFTDVEAAGTYKRPAVEFVTLFKKAGLRIVSTGADFATLEKDPGRAVKEAQALGAGQVMCAWIPHQGRFSRVDVDKALPVFANAGRAMRDAGLRFLYHLHGYEFQRGPDGTLFDALAKGTEPGVVDFQMDVFWVFHGGGSPTELFSQHPGRFPSTHLKDMRKGTKVCEPTGDAPDETSVPLGDGMIDIPGILDAANKDGVTYHFIEDEHPRAEHQIPRSLKYLASLR
jgi:sugar phosphate isomerase/epimerase